MAEPTRITVSGANDGPWCSQCPCWDAEWAQCQVMQSTDPDTGRVSYADTPLGPAPDWCPLRSGGVLVVLGGEEAPVD